MRTRLSSARHLPIALGSLALLGLPFPALAQLSVDLSARAGVATNPLQGAGSTPVTATATLGIRPSWVDRSELTTLQLDGYAETAFYSEDYGTNANISVQGSGTHRLSEYTSLSANLGYVNSIVGSFNGIGGQIGTPVVGLPTTDPAVTPGGAAIPVIQPTLPFVITDPSLGRIGRRQQSYLAAGALSTTLSARDQVSLQLAASANRAGGSGISDFNYVTPTVAYSRALGERFSVGARFSAGFTDYLGTDIGDAIIYQPSLTVTRGITTYWTLTAALGAAIIDLNEPGGGSRSSTTFNGSADLCRQDERWSACFSASRQTVPSTFQGVRTQTGVSASVSYRINGREDLGFSGSYSHASDPIQRTLTSGLADGSTDFVTAAGTYSRRIGPALFGNVTLGYTKAFDDVAQRDANFTALAGVTYRLGRQR